MAELLETSSSLTIPHGAPYAERFLTTILTRTEQMAFGLDLSPRENRGRLFLEAKLVFGNFWKRSKERRLEVFADPIGPSLSVGWQLSAKGTLIPTELAQTAAALGDMVDADPRFQRELEAVVVTFNDLVFEPVVDLLVDAIESR